MSAAATAALHATKEIIDDSEFFLNALRVNKVVSTKVVDVRAWGSLQTLVTRFREGVTVVTVTPEMMDLLVASETSLPSMEWDNALLPWPSVFVHFQKSVAVGDPPEPQDADDEALRVRYRQSGIDENPPYVGIGWVATPLIWMPGDQPEMGTACSFFYKERGRFGSNMGIGLQNGRPVEKEEDEFEGIAPTRFLAALVLLLGQRIATPHQVFPARQAARQWTRSIETEVPTVIEVTLRRLSAPSEDPNANRDTDWSHRWIVGGHWRDQYLPSTKGHRPTWIAPYVKGPDDKPLVVKEKVYRWSR